MGSRTLPKVLGAACSIVLAALLAVSVPVSAAFADDADNPANRTVKAGIFAFDGYHMEDDAGILYGYGIEVLEMISKYSHLNFELVGYESSWRDMLDMLEHGEIDVVTSASKTPEREAKFDYSLPIGKKSTVLSVAVDDDRFVAGNYPTYDGIVVGEIAGNSQNDIFSGFAAEKGFAYTAVEFESDEALARALQAGEVDAILTSDLRKAENEKTLDTIEDDNYYAIVRKGDTELLDEINYAIEQMNQNEGDWKNTLHYEHYGPTYSNELAFTPREQAYIEQVRSGQKSITATAHVDQRPYSYEENGELTGILIDYLSAVMAVADLPYEIVMPDDLEDYETMIRNEDVDVILDGITGDSSSVDYFADGFSSDAFMGASVVQVMRTDFDGEVRSIAVSDSSTGSLDAFLAEQGDVELIHYPDREQALQAVLNGSADCAYAYVYTAQEFMSRDMTNALTYSSVYGLDVQFDMRISADADHELVTILNKCIKQVPESTLSGLVAQYTSYSASELTVFQYLQANPALIGVIVLVIIGVIGAIAALVYRSRQKEALAEALAQAQYANHAKTTFLNSMSHDIRTPMNAIIGFTALASTHMDDADQVRDYLSKITISSNHLLSLINDVLDMSRIESGKVRIEERETNLPAVIRDLHTIVQADIEAKGLEFSINMDDVRDVDVICDKLRLNQVLLNILSNAIKYTQPGGSVSVRVEEPESERRDGSAVYRFIVKDTGIGMSPAFLEHVFEPFEREETATVSGIQGTGLGLAITKNLVDMMDGTIAVESIEGTGSEFTVTFRFEIAEAAQGGEAPAGSETLASEGPSMDADRLQGAFNRAVEQLKGTRVLLAEDNMMSREIEVTVLEDAEIVVDAVEDGTYAVERMREMPAGTYDVVLTDVQMPIMNGYETARAIRALDDPAKASIPIIAVTANAFEEDREEAEDAGMSGYIPKPIDIEKLFNVLEGLLGSKG